MRERLQDVLDGSMFDEDEELLGRKAGCDRRESLRMRSCWAYMRSRGPPSSAAETMKSRVFLNATFGLYDILSSRAVSRTS